MMNWKEVKKIALNGINTSLIPVEARAELIPIFDQRVRVIEDIARTAVQLIAEQPVVAPNILPLTIES